MMKKEKKQRAAPLAATHHDKQQTRAQQKQCKTKTILAPKMEKSLRFQIL